jgi:hypothetical protein
MGLLIVGDAGPCFSTFLFIKCQGHSTGQGTQLHLPTTMTCCTSGSLETHNKVMSLWYSCSDSPPPIPKSFRSPCMLGPQVAWCTSSKPTSDTVCSQQKATRTCPWRPAWLDTQPRYSLEAPNPALNAFMSCPPSHTHCASPSSTWRQVHSAEEGSQGSTDREIV